jgi:hypothetical protein
MKKEGQKNKEKICKREEVLSVVAEGEKWIIPMKGEIKRRGSRSRRRRENSKI